MGQGAEEKLTILDERPCPASSPSLSADHLSLSHCKSHSVASPLHLLQWLLLTSPFSFLHPHPPRGVVSSAFPSSRPWERWEMHQRELRIGLPLGREWEKRHWGQGSSLPLPRNSWPPKGQSACVYCMLEGRGLRLCGLPGTSSYRWGDTGPGRGERGLTACPRHWEPFSCLVSCHPHNCSARCVW